MLQFYLQLIETEEDQELFTFLYENYRQRMRLVASENLDNDSFAEDAVHNAFIGVTKNMASIRDRCREDQRNYLLKAAKYAAYNINRTERKQEEYYVVIEEEAVADSVLDALCAKLDREAIVNAIEEIKEPYNTVLFFSLLMEMEHKEIASLLDRTPDAIRQQIHRGKGMLKKRLEEALAVHV